jgi:hypothetical protein
MTIDSKTAEQLRAERHEATCSALAEVKMGFFYNQRFIRAQDKRLASAISRIFVDDNGNFRVVEDPIVVNRRPQDGMRARHLSDHEVERFIQSAQDVLTQCDAERASEGSENWRDQFEREIAS